MEIRKAELSDAQTVRDIVQTTITAVYPHYYPAGAVSFFLAHHHENAIREDIACGHVWICCDGGRSVGTVTVKGNEILRLFVLPDEQGKGFGKALLDLAEHEVLREHAEILIDASLSAKPLYLKRGYRECGYYTISAGEDYLCYDQMIMQA